MESSSEAAPADSSYSTASSSSSSSPESNFRELDDAFLQSQTRIWLEEVLQIRIDEQLIISELLADGELLFQVSKVVWKLLLAKHMEPRHIKAYKNQPFASKKIGGRYRPYSNVDSFLKICKILGLTGIDLFTPSDVVERRNTRRVCMCIRSFSKKSRSININVPDFDVVTCMVAMPKDMVRCIRRSIELSHSILADSASSYDLQKHARRKSIQGYAVAGSTRDYKTDSDQSEDTENNHLELQFDGLHTGDLRDFTSDIDYDIDSPTESEDLDQMNIQNRLINEELGDDFELLCSVESLQCHCSENLKHNYKLSWSSSPPCVDLHSNFVDMTSPLDTRLKQVQESRRIMDFDYVQPMSLSSNVSIIETPTNDITPGKIDVSLLTKDRKDSDVFHEEISTPSLYQSASSHGSNPTPQSTDNGNCFENGDNMEVLQVAAMCCYSKEALNLGDQFDAENNFQRAESFKMHKDKNDQLDKIKEAYESQGIMKCREKPHGIISNPSYSYSVKKIEETEPPLCSPDCYVCNTNNSSDTVVPHGSDIRSSSLKKKLSYDERESQVDLKRLNNARFNQSEESCKWDQKGKCVTESYRGEGNKNSSDFLEDGPYEETTPCKQNDSEILMSMVVLSCVQSEENVVNEAVIKLGTDGKELNNDCVALATNSPGVEKCNTLGDNGDGVWGKEGFTTQDIGDGGQKVLRKITNDATLPANCEEDFCHTESYITNQSSKLECYDGNIACHHKNDPVFLSEHTRVMHIKEDIKPEDQSVHFLENLVETEEGDTKSPKRKSQKKLLLRSVLGGAAAVGLLFVIFHLRGNGDEKAALPSKAPSHKGKEKIQKNSPQKVKKTTTMKGVYPAEKLNLK